MMHTEHTQPDTITPEEFERLQRISFAFDKLRRELTKYIEQHPETIPAEKINVSLEMARSIAENDPGQSPETIEEMMAKHDTRNPWNKLQRTPVDIEWLEDLIEKTVEKTMKANKS